MPRPFDVLHPPLSRRPATSSPPACKSCRKPRGPGAAKIVFHPAATDRLASSRAAWHSSANPPRLWESRPSPSPDGMPFADFLRHRLGLGHDVIHQKQFGDVFHRQPQRRHLPCPAGPEQQHFRPRQFQLRSSRNERAMPSASVLKPCDRISPETGSELCSGRQCPPARASNRTVLTAPHVFADSSSTSTIPARATCAARSGSGRKIASPWRRQWRRANGRDGLQTRGNASSSRARRTRRCASRATRNGGWESHRPRNSASRH